MEEIRVVKLKTFRCDNTVLTLVSKTLPDHSWEVLGIKRPRDPLSDPALFEEFLKFNLHRVYPTFVHAVQDFLETWYPAANFCIDLYCLDGGYGWTPSWVRELWRELPNFLTGADLLIRMQTPQLFWELIDVPVEWWITPEWLVRVKRPHWRIGQSNEAMLAGWRVKECAPDWERLIQILSELHPKVRFAPAPLVVQAK
jgi:hypothetical protein